MDKTLYRIRLDKDITRKLKRIATLRKMRNRDVVELEIFKILQNKDKLDKIMISTKEKVISNFFYKPFLSRFVKKELNVTLNNLLEHTISGDNTELNLKKVSIPFKKNDYEKMKIEAKKYNLSTKLFVTLILEDYVDTRDIYTITQEVKNYDMHKEVRMETALDSKIVEMIDIFGSRLIQAAFTNYNINKVEILNTVKRFNDFSKKESKI